MQQMQVEGQQELIVRRNYGREGQQTLADMAHQLGLYLYVLRFLVFFLAQHCLGSHIICCFECILLYFVNFWITSQHHHHHCRCKSWKDFDGSFAKCRSMKKNASKRLHQEKQALKGKLKSTKEIFISLQNWLKCSTILIYIGKQILK